MNAFSATTPHEFLHGPVFGQHGVQACKARPTIAVV